jgi:hypothetical protein
MQGNERTPSIETELIARMSPSSDLPGSKMNILLHRRGFTHVTYRALMILCLGITGVLADDIAPDREAALRGIPGRESASLTDGKVEGSRLMEAGESEFSEQERPARRIVERDLPPPLRIQINPDGTRTVLRTDGAPVPPSSSFARVKKEVIESQGDLGQGSVTPTEGVPLPAPPIRRAKFGPEENESSQSATEPVDNAPATD